MYLKKFQMKNFRKYREDDNVFSFVNAEGIKTRNIDRDKKGQKTSVKEIDVASATTLIVGKNNTGKTSVIQALQKIIRNNENDRLSLKDINFSYLQSCFSQYHANYTEAEGDKSKMVFEPPFIEFIVTIAFEENSDDLVTNLVPFMLLKDIDKDEIELIIKYEIMEKEEFDKAIIAACKRIENRDKKKRSDDKKKADDNEGLETEFQTMFKELENVKFQLTYHKRYQEEGEEELKTEKIEKNFKLSSLMDIKSISANNVKKVTALTDAFNKIISYRYDKIVEDKQKLEEDIGEINGNLTKSIRGHHQDGINHALGEIVATDVMKVNLSADITVQKLVRNLLRYEYEEKGLNIPEEQFGLGYTHLVMIIAELIDYMEHYPEDEYNSKINLIAIEEPESFMHPQMQELFIKNINEALKRLIKEKQRNLNSQLIVTTHSSHILNSKIHTGNSFDDICYVYSGNGQACVVNLYDKVIIPGTEQNEEVNNDSEEERKKREEELKKKQEKDFEFLKKHIKYKVSELFFADAAILVEGSAEETILPFYLEQEERIKKRYISVFGISGAHAFLYEKLLKELKIPTLIITDLDIERERVKKEDNQDQTAKKKEKKYSQIDDLEGKKTTNRTIKYFRKTDSLSDLPSHMKIGNIYIAYQQKVGKYFPTSFEEAMILTNAENVCLNNILKAIKPDIYKEIVGTDDKIDYGQNVEQSFKWQEKLSNAKGRFASELLYALIAEEISDRRPKLPDYIKNGIDWLVDELGED